MVLPLALHIGVAQMGRRGSRESRVRRENAIDFSRDF